jgi:hypothetical protein
MVDLKNLNQERTMKQKTGSAVIGYGDGQHTNAIYLIAVYACHSGAKGRFDSRMKAANHTHWSASA